MSFCMLKSLFHSMARSTATEHECAQSKLICLNKQHEALTSNSLKVTGKRSDSKEQQVGILVGPSVTQKVTEFIPNATSRLEEDAPCSHSLSTWHELNPLNINKRQRKGIYIHLHIRNKAFKVTPNPFSRHRVDEKKLHVVKKKIKRNNYRNGK